MTEEAADDGRLIGADVGRWLGYWLVGMPAPLGPPSLVVNGCEETSLPPLFLLPPLLLLALAISALTLSRSTSAAWDFLSVFLTKLVMITLQRISTSSRR